jgi:uncharacterized protein (TIGR00369 family)
MPHPSIALLDQEMNRLHGEFSAAELPPKCFTHMHAEFVEYESRQMLKVSVPVLEEYLNPMKAMQGGFITAAFDNTFGPLSYLAARHPCITLQIQTNYIRPILAGDTLTVTARVVSRGGNTMYLSAEAHNSKGKLVATATTHMALLNV